VYYFAHDGVRVFNGSTSQVISGKIRGTFNDTILKSAMGSAVGVYYNDTYQLWCVEKDGVSDELYPDLAIVYYEPLNAWTLWRPGRLGEASSGPYPNCFAVLGKELYMGLATSSQIVKCFDGYDDIGNPIYAYMTTKELNLGTPERYKFFHHLYAVTEAVPGAYSLTVECTTEHSAENRTYSFPLQDVDDNLIENRKTIALRARYLQAKFSVEGEDEDGVAEPYGPFGLLGYRLGFTPQQVK
jgi:hypothetical protein